LTGEVVVLLFLFFLFIVLFEFVFHLLVLISPFFFDWLDRGDSNFFEKKKKDR